MEEQTPQFARQSVAARVLVDKTRHFDSVFPNNRDKNIEEKMLVGLLLHSFTNLFKALRSKDINDVARVGSAVRRGRVRNLGHSTQGILNTYARLRILLPA